jgi:hypothetical protein
LDAGSLPWVEFCDFLRSLPENRQLKTVWHPHPRQNFVRLLNGRVAVALKGEPAYQAEDSDIVRIQARA